MVAFYSTSKMETENFGEQLHFDAHPSSPRGVYKKGRTYLAMIASVLQDSPDKMLTFSKLINKLKAYVTGDKKCFENNIRVCLSTSKCFVKIPMSPLMPNCKINYWKLDHSQITSKMVRRHFKGILARFPELASKLRKETVARSPEHFTTFDSSEAAPCSAVKSRCELKFSSPFSIESLLKNSPSALDSKPSPRSPLSTLVRGEPHLPWFTDGVVGTTRRVSSDSPRVETYLQGSSGRYPIHTTWDITGRCSANDARLMTMMPMFTEAPFLINSRPSIAPYVTCQQSCYTNYPVHTFNRDVQPFCL